jgi:NAD(P)-dependent dehydrogenase (short-subunit alcohol dehydrogenase family)
MARPSRPVALITGASRGIGRALALALADGHELWLCARKIESLDETVAAVGERDGLRRFACDLADAGARKAFLSELEAAGQVDILVNNAGLAESAPLARTGDDLWDRAIDVNLRAPFELARALAPTMAKRGWGRIVNVASTAGLKGYRYTSAYCASKAGLIGLTKALAVELARKGVTVNAVCPGFTDTDIASEAVENIVSKTGQSEDDARKALSSFSPQGRLMSPQEIAASVGYLVSEAAAGITGQALAVDGGETA